MTNVTEQMPVPVLAKETGLLDRQVHEAASINVGIETDALEATEKPR